MSPERFVKGRSERTSFCPLEDQIKRLVDYVVGLSGLTIFLLLADLRSGLGDAAFYQISLNLELLVRA